MDYTAGPDVANLNGFTAGCAEPFSFLPPMPPASPGDAFTDIHIYVS